MSPTADLPRTVGAPALGLAIAVAAVTTQPGRETPEWTVWAPVALAVGVSSGAAFTYGRRRLDELSSQYQLARGPIWLRALLVLVAALLIANVTLVLPGAAHATPHDTLLGSLALVLGSPLLASMFAVRAAVLAGSADPTHGSRLKRLMSLRGVLDRVLATAGALVALVTIEHSTRQLLNQSLHHTATTRPAAYVLIFGAFGSLTVAVGFVSGWAALRSQGQELLDQLLPIESLTEPSGVVLAMRERKDVANILGIDRSILTDLSAGVVILSPIITAAIGAFVAR